jgi:hypothetical protein
VKALSAVVIVIGLLLVLSGCGGIGNSELSSHAKDYGALTVAVDPKAPGLATPARVGKIVPISADRDAIDGDLFKLLPDTVRATSDAEVGTIAYIEHGYYDLGVYKDPKTGGVTGDAKQDVVEIYLVDRLTGKQLWYELILAERPSETAAAGGMHTRVDINRVAGFLSNLPEIQPTDLTSTTTEPPPAKFGDTQSLSDIELTVDAPEADPGEPSADETKDVYVVLVTIRNNGSELVAYDSVYFAAQDAAGVTYRSMVVLLNVDDLGSGTLAQGETAKGYVGFELPAATAVALVRYDVEGNTVLGDVAGSWAR